MSSEEQEEPIGVDGGDPDEMVRRFGQNLADDSERIANGEDPTDN
jgi:hypothetical protein